MFYIIGILTDIAFKKILLYVKPGMHLVSKDSFVYGVATPKAINHYDSKPPYINGIEHSQCIDCVVVKCYTIPE